MKNNKDIGKAFKDKLEGFDSIPDENLWLKIETNLNSIYKKKFAFKFYSVFLAIGLCCGIVYIYLEKNQNKKTANTLIINKKNTTTELKKIDTAKKTLNESPTKTTNGFVVSENNPKSSNNNTSVTYFKRSDSVINPIQNTNISIEKEKTISSTHKINDQKTASLESTKIISKKSNNDYSPENQKQEKDRQKNKNQITKNPKLKSPSQKKVIKPNPNNEPINKERNNTTYSLEAAKYIKNSKRLVESTEDYDKYEVVKKYTYIVKKKKKTINKPQNKTSQKKKRANHKLIIKKNKKSLNTIEKNENSNHELNDFKNDSTNSKLLPEKEKTIASSIPKKKIKKDSIIKDKKTRKNIIYITPYIGPSISNSFNHKNSFSDQYNLAYNNNLPIINFGLYVRAMMSKKIGFRAGISIINSKYESTINKDKDVFLDYRNIDYQIYKTENDFSTIFINDSQVIFKQKIKNLEIPLELYYEWTNNKIGFATSAGIGFLFLLNNELSIRSKSVEEFLLGKPKNLTKISYTGNLNLIFFYKLNSNINFEISPSIKYQIKGFERTNTFEPYILTFQTGLSYKY